MKENRKEFIFVIGKSRGMDQEAMLKGFNALVDCQKKIDDESIYTLVFFNESFKESCSGKSMKEMRKYNALSYKPKGGSALFDAMGYTMDMVGERLANTSQSEMPCQVCMIVIGESDDASTVYEYSRVCEMINLQKYTYKWDFVFYGDGKTHFDINKGGNFNNAERMFSDINSYITTLR